MRPHRVSWAVALLLVGAAISSTGRAGPQDPGTFWRDPARLTLLGVERLAASDFREAIPILAAAVETWPQDVRARAWLAHGYHLARRLDEAGVHYAALLRRDPVAEVSVPQRAIILALAPRLYQVDSDPFALADAVAIHHPDEPLIAYHFFWEDDIDFPADNDPTDHELVWVRYDPDTRQPVALSTYFHGRILESATALADASAHDGRFRVNVEWGKHGSMPHGWEALEIRADAGDAERSHGQMGLQTLAGHNRATFETLTTAGRRMVEHPRTATWPVRFTGDWEAFIRFDRAVDLRGHLAAPNRLAVSRWNNAVLQQRMLAYNFRPKTDWPAAMQQPTDLAAAWVGGDLGRVLPASARALLREAAAVSPDPFLRNARARERLPFDLPPMDVFDPATPRYPNVWFYGSIEKFQTYDAFVRFVNDSVTGAGYDTQEVDLSEGADMAFSVEHLQPWPAVRGLRHAHAVHIRLFWTRLEEAARHRTDAKTGTDGRFWRIAASVHYEVEHAHPLHADVVVCPYCGGTGEYALLGGPLVERVHDPLGVEILLRGTIRGERVRRDPDTWMQGLERSLALAPDDVVLSPSYRDDMNTAVLAVVLIREGA